MSHLCHNEISKRTINVWLTFSERFNFTFRLIQHLLRERGLSPSPYPYIGFSFLKSEAICLQTELAGLTHDPQCHFFYAGRCDPVAKRAGTIANTTTMLFGLEAKGMVWIHPFYK